MKMIVQLLFLVILFPDKSLSTKNYSKTGDNCQEVLHSEEPYFLHQGICYVLNRQRLYFNEAAKACKQFPSGHLASIENRELIEIVNEVFEPWQKESKDGPNPGHWSYYWVGLTQLCHDEPGGGWFWVKANNNYKPAVDVPWGNNEPNDYGGPEDCAAYTSTQGGLIADYGCRSEKFYSICQFEYVQNKNDSDCISDWDRELMPLLNQGWQTINSTISIQKDFIFTDFNQAFGFMTHVALKSEQFSHYPESWLQSYNKVTVMLTTFDCEGLSQKDVKLANFIENCANSM